MKNTKLGSCGHDKMERKGKGKGYVEVEIKMVRSPKKKTKRK